jgi:hypothetical protein
VGCVAAQPSSTNQSSLVVIVVTLPRIHKVAMYGGFVPRAGKEPSEGDVLKICQFIVSGKLDKVSLLRYQPPDAVFPAMDNLNKEPQSCFVSHFQ